MLAFGHHFGYVSSMAIDLAFKARENRARRAAERQGMILRRNPRRDQRAPDYGSYVLEHAHNGHIVADFGWARHGTPTGADWLADVETHLARGRSPQ